MVALLNKIKNLFASPKPVALESGQLAIDSSVGFVNAQLWYAALKREERLATYDFLYDNTPLVEGAINILVGLANTPLYADTGDATLDREVNAVLDYLGLEEINPAIDRNLLVYGFNSAEIVLTPDLGAIKKVAVIPSLETRYRVNAAGDITKVLQIPRAARSPGANPATPGIVEIDPDKCLTMQRNVSAINQHYGRSLFQTSVASIDALSKIFDCQVKIYSRFGNPRYTIEVDNNGVASEEIYRDILQRTAAQFRKGDNLVGPMGTKATIVGAEGAVLRWRDETNLVVSNILAATGVPSSLLNFNVGGQTESYARQQVLVLMASIRTLQRLKAQQYVRKLMPIVSAVYDFPPITKLTYEPARLLEAQQEQTARQLQRELDWQDAVDGVISPETFAMRQDVTEPYDLDVLQERIESARTSMQEPQSSAENKDNSTKLSDEKQSSSKAA